MTNYEYTLNRIESLRRAEINSIAKCKYSMAYIWSMLRVRLQNQLDSMDVAWAGMEAQND